MTRRDSACKVVALFDGRGVPVPRVVIGNRVYEQGQVLPETLDEEVCTLCAGIEGCECSENVLAREWEPRRPAAW